MSVYRRKKIQQHVTKTWQYYLDYWDLEKKQKQHYILLLFALFKLELNCLKSVELFVVINAIDLWVFGQE